MDRYWKILIEIIQETALIFTYGGMVVALVVGLWMMVHPASLYRFNEFLSKWYSTRRAMKPLTRPRKSEPVIYRHHRIFGLFILFGAGYVLYTLVFRFSKSAFMQALYGTRQQAPAVEWLVEGLIIVLAVCSTLAFIVGIYLVIRPSLLKGLEAWGNKWITLRRATKVFDIVRTGPEPFFRAHPRFVATFIILGSIYALFGLRRYF